MAKQAFKGLVYHGTTALKTNEWTLDDGRGEQDVSINGCEFALTLATLRKIAISFKILWDESDATFSALHTEYVNRTSATYKCISFLDATGTGNGLTGSWHISKFSNSQDSKGPLFAEIEIVPTGAIAAVEASIVSPSPNPAN